MLTMTQIHHIRKMYFEEGASISKIAETTGHDRKTIRKYLEKENWNQDMPETLPEAPSFPSLEPFKNTIHQWLTEDKRARLKQRHSAKRVFNRLKEEFKDEFDLSYRTVAGYVAQEKERVFGKKLPAALPLEHIPGEAQVDFGGADFYENGKLHSGKYLNMSFPYSNQGYVLLYKGENQQCLLEGLQLIFDHMGGVPGRIWFDNASTMVTKIMKNGERKLTDAFLRFQEHYRFESAFCNPNSGWEKGSVESKVGYHRRNLLVPVPHVQDLTAFNQELLTKCDEDSQRPHYRKTASIYQLHQEDRQALLPLPSVPLDVAHYTTVPTDAYGRFTLEKGNHEYSASPRYASGHVHICLTAHHVKVLDDSHRVVVCHKRLYGDHKQQSMQWLPYLNQLARKPGALKYTGIYHLFPQSLQEYLKECGKQDQGKILKTIAHLTEQDHFDSAVKTVETALLHHAFDPDSLLAVHTRLHNNTLELPPLRLQGHIPVLTPVSPDLSLLDQALHTRGGGRKC